MLNFKQVVDLIVEKNDKSARKELQKIIQNHPLYVDYKNRLREAGIETEIEVPEDAVLKIQDLLKNMTILHNFKSLMLRIS